MFKKKHVAPKATYRETFAKGDGATKLSFFLMGSNAFANKQWVKGIVFLLSEIVFFVWFFMSGIPALKLLSNLGPDKTKRVVYDASQGVYVTKQPSNSVLILLFGILALFMCIAFVWIYYLNLRSTRKNYIAKRDGDHIATNMEELKSLFDSRLHSTLMTIPLLGILFFTVLPTVFMISMAFTNYDRQHSIAFSWTGFQAFGNVLSGDLAGTFFPVLGWTLIWAVAATATTFFFGVLLAMLIESKGIKHKGFWRTIFVVVWAVPQFVSLLMMAQFLDYQGALNNILMNLHLISSPIHFIDNQASPLVARITVIIVNMWIGIPVSMLVSTAIIQNLPQDQIEAARIDGANAAQIFRSITFPQILFVMAPSLIQQFIGNINNFNVIFLLTGGAPMNSKYNGAGSTDLLVTWLYNLTFGQEQRYNASAVLGILIFVISAVVSLLAYRRTNAFKEG
ncbi:carbohydrate ABC transporter permease [Lactobacillus hominis]|uniref:Maltose/maltodextrin transport system permease protein n=1 Tax=Lactobacillus hominis DSM 23910 = CRBIP 24.179 TaxID=1423758 RepID=I7L6J3_9LACO|nr:sugar ABC transporter permease [Lactobacillus hominis]KRM84534.1 cyclodextrin ABC superfamily ATP binding cassette transporter, membrane protein [Lactobacillus hominis DSM 23910 = CRBIP 24.179]MCT3348397.1 sugar ABC transporter permease [Lactobacillus hominis]CCI82052.1 Maltose ABC transporter, permease protein [Lactobacillus hominis DSM 23910 = CRBIP 24.179]